MPPADPALPALVTAQAHGWHDVLAACGIQAAVRSARVVRHHPGSRCVLDVQTEDGRRFAVKAFRRDPEAGAAMLTRLAAAGLAEPRGPSITVLAGYDARLACLILDWLPGEPAVALIAGDRGARVGEFAAGWLLAAAAVPPAGLEPYDAESMLTDLDRWCGAIERADGPLGARAAEVSRRLGTELPPSGHPGLLHLSFSVNHLVDLGDGPGVLDWDELRRGPLELDAGAFLATLVRHAAQHPARSGQTSDASAALRDGASQQLDPVAVAWYRRAALVKHAKHACATHRSGWRRLAGDLLDEAT